MYWRYRVRRRIDLFENGYTYDIVEVYDEDTNELDDFDEDLGAEPAQMWTQDSVAPVGNSRSELKRELRNMIRALDLPTLHETGVKLKPCKAKKKKQQSDLW